MKLIKQIAVNKKITIRKIAQEVGITEQGLQSIIRNNTTTTDNLEKISKVLNVPISTFFTENENSNIPIETEFSTNKIPPGKSLSNDERIDILLSQNDRLITVLEKHSQTINTNSNTINNLSGTINNLSYLSQNETRGQLPKNVSGEAS